MCKWRSVRLCCHESPHGEAIGSLMRLFYTVSESVFSETQIYNGGSLCVGTGAMHPFGKGPSRKSASWAEVSAPSAGPLLLSPPGHQRIGSGHSDRKSVV